LVAEKAITFMVYSCGLSKVNKGDNRLSLKCSFTIGIRKPLNQVAALNLSELSNKQIAEHFDQTMTGSYSKAQSQAKQLEQTSFRVDELRV